jgi:biotin transport system substrate-specific component
LSLTLSNRTTLVDRVVPRSFVADIALVVLGAVLIYASTFVTIPLGFTPVPLTGQTFAVLLTASALGLNRGTLSTLLYAIVGWFGAPVFASHTSAVFSFQSPTLGYVVGFIAGSAVVGWLAQLGWDKNPLLTVASFVIGNVVIYGFGVAWLANFFAMNGYPHDLASVLNAGLIPFLAGDAIKIALAAGVLPSAWLLVNKIKGTK